MGEEYFFKLKIPRAIGVSKYFFNYNMMYRLLRILTTVFLGRAERGIGFYLAVRA